MNAKLRSCLRLLDSLIGLAIVLGGIWTAWLAFSAKWSGHYDEATYWLVWTLIAMTDPTRPFRERPRCLTERVDG